MYLWLSKVLLLEEYDKEKELSNATNKIILNPMFEVTEIKQQCWLEKNVNYRVASLIKKQILW